MLKVPRRKHLEPGREQNTTSLWKRGVAEAVNRIFSFRTKGSWKIWQVPVTWVCVSPFSLVVGQTVTRSSHSTETPLWKNQAGSRNTSDWCPTAGTSLLPEMSLSLWVNTTVTPYLVVEPGAGNLWSASISQHIVLHAFHTGMFPHLRPEWRLIVLHFCWREQADTGLEKGMRSWDADCQDSPVITLGWFLILMDWKYIEGSQKDLELVNTWLFGDHDMLMAGDRSENKINKVRGYRLLGSWFLGGRNIFHITKVCGPTEVHST